MISRAKENPFERRTPKQLGHGNQTKQKGRQFLDTVKNLNANLFFYLKSLREHTLKICSLYFDFNTKGTFSKLYNIQLLSEPKTYPAFLFC